MESLLERIQQLEARTGRMERQVRSWRIFTFLVVVGAVSVLAVLPGQAQLVTGNGSTLTAPVVVKGTDGVKILEIDEFIDKARENSHDTLLTLYRNGLPASILRTTGQVYKDAGDPDVNFLNTIETWLYRYPKDAQGKYNPTAYLAASTALTRGGGSIVVFNEQSSPTETPPFAARLTSVRGVGGAVVLYNPDGSEAKALRSK